MPGREPEIVYEIFQIRATANPTLPSFLCSCAEAATRRGFSERTGFATIGTFKHPPNVDAARWGGLASSPHLFLYLLHPLSPPINLRTNPVPSSSLPAPPTFLLEVIPLHPLAEQSASIPHTFSPAAPPLPPSIQVARTRGLAADPPPPPDRRDVHLWQLPSH